MIQELEILKERVNKDVENRLQILMRFRTEQTEHSADIVLKTEESIA